MAYEKQQWDTTSFVNPTRMNHIEEGIKANSDEVASLNTDLANTKKDVSDLNNDLKNTKKDVSDLNSNLSKIQSGVTTTVGASSSANIKLAVPYSNTNYTVIATVEFKDTESKFCVANVYKRTNDSFTIYTFDSATDTPVGGITVSWVAIGN